MSYQAFMSLRATEPDRATLLAQLRALDSSVGVQHDPYSARYLLKRDGPWGVAAVNAAQAVIDTCPAQTAQSLAQTEIDNWPLSVKALVLTLIDQLNMLRSLHSLSTITPAQVLAAVRTKAGTL